MIYSAPVHRCRVQWQPNDVTTTTVFVLCRAVCVYSALTFSFQILTNDVEFTLLFAKLYLNLSERENVKFAAGTIKAFVDLHKLKIMHGSAQNEDFLPESSHKTISILGCYLSWRLWAVSCMHRGRVRDIYPLPLCDGDPTLTMFICHCQKVGYYEWSMYNISHYINHVRLGGRY